MDELTQQNAALVEQNASSAKALEQQSQAMNERMRFFQVDAVAPSDEKRPAVIVDLRQSAPAKRSAA